MANGSVVNKSLGKIYIDSEVGVESEVPHKIVNSRLNVAVLNHYEVGSNLDLILVDLVAVAVGSKVCLLTEGVVTDSYLFLLIGLYGLVACELVGHISAGGVACAVCYTVLGVGVGVIEAGVGDKDGRTRINGVDKSGVIGLGLTDYGTVVNSPGSVRSRKVEELAGAYGVDDGRILDLHLTCITGNEEAGIVNDVSYVVSAVDVGLVVICAGINNSRTCVEEVLAVLTVLSTDVRLSVLTAVVEKGTAVVIVILVYVLSLNEYATVRNRGVEVNNRVSGGLEGVLLRMSCDHVTVKVELYGASLGNVDLKLVLYDVAEELDIGGLGLGALAEVDKKIVSSSTCVDILANCHGVECTADLFVNGIKTNIAGCGNCAKLIKLV